MRTKRYVYSPLSEFINSWKLGDGISTELQIILIISSLYWKLRGRLFNGKLIAMETWFLRYFSRPNLKRPSDCSDQELFRRTIFVCFIRGESFVTDSTVRKWHGVVLHAIHSTFSAKIIFNRFVRSSFVISHKMDINVIDPFAKTEWLPLYTKCDCSAFYIRKFSSADTEHLIHYSIFVFAMTFTVSVSVFWRVLME